MPKSVELPNVVLLRECFDYDPEIGELLWKERPLTHFTCVSQQSRFNKRYAGKTIRTKDSAGYYMVDVNKRSYKAHRIIYAIMSGFCPPNMEVDHINGVRTDNRISNLRLVSSSMNSRNRKLRSDNKTGVNGVSFDKECGLFAANVRFNGKWKRLGRFRSIEEASQARQLWMSSHKSEGYTSDHGLRL